jgi:type IV pilus assembly protein PilA
MTKMRLPTPSDARRSRARDRDRAVPARDGRGFTLIEVMVVVAIVAILATMALPGLQGGIVRDQIVSSLPLANIAKGPIARAWAATQTLPVDNAGAGLPAADRIVNNAIRAVEVEKGAIHVTFGNSAHAALSGKVLTLRPAVVEDAPVVPVTWICAQAAVPNRMTVRGEDRTTVPEAFLPISCRRPAQ